MITFCCAPFYSTEFPVPDPFASSILSPLMLAGCATVNSEVHYEHLPLITIEARVKRFEISLLYQPQSNGKPYVFTLLP